LRLKWFRNYLNGLQKLNGSEILSSFILLFVDKAYKNDSIELNNLNINKNKEETMNHIDKITVLF